MVVCLPEGLQRERHGCTGAVVVPHGEVRAGPPPSTGCGSTCPGRGRPPGVPALTGGVWPVQSRPVLR